MSAETLATGVGQEEGDLLSNEGPLLALLQFDLITYPPYRAIDGFFQVNCGKFSRACCATSMPAPDLKGDRGVCS